MADEDDNVATNSPEDEEQATALQEPLEVRRERISRKREHESFWKAVFADPIGRREMWALLQDMHPFETVFACGPSGFPQPEATWFKAGEQQLGLRLYQSWHQIDPEGVMLMQRENDSRFAKPRKRKTNGRD